MPLKNKNKKEQVLQRLKKSYELFKILWEKKAVVMPKGLMILVVLYLIYESVLRIFLLLQKLSNQLSRVFDEMRGFLNPKIQAESVNIMRQLVRMPDHRHLGVCHLSNIWHANISDIMVQKLFQLVMVSKCEIKPTLLRHELLLSLVVLVHQDVMSVFLLVMVNIFLGTLGMLSKSKKYHLDLNSDP